MFRDIFCGRFNYVFRGLYAIFIDDCGDSITQRHRASYFVRAIREIDDGRTKAASTDEADVLFSVHCFLVTCTFVNQFGRHVGRVRILAIPFTDFR